jgi:hypothetical protein
MRRERVDLRVLPDEKVRWAEAAELQGLNLSEMIRQAMNPWVESVLANTSASGGGSFHVETAGAWRMVDGKVIRREG